jgi:hypothetical protein
MKRINFINTIPPSKQKEVRIWFGLCIITVIIFISTIIIINGTQWYLYKTLQQQKKELSEQVTQFATIMANQRHQLEEQEQLQKKLDTIQRYRINPKNPIGILSLLRKATQDLSLQSSIINSKQFECNAFCSSASQAANCIKCLSKEKNVRNIQLASLQTHQDKILITIKGMITTKLRDIK